MKIACLGDTHINVLNTNEMYNHTIKTFEYFQQFCKDENAEMVVILGDLFDAKTTTSTEGLIRIVKIINNIANSWPIFIVVGNHDIAISSDTSVCLPNVFQGKHNITIADHYTNYENGNAILHFLPYYDDSTIIENIKKIEITDGKKNYLFGHFGVRGSTMNVYGNNKEFIDRKSSCLPTHLKKFNHVFLGHYHGYHNIEHVTYVSAPLQLKHGDEKWRHGFVSVDTDTNTHKFIDNKHTPVHITMELNNETINEIGKLQNAYIRLVVPANLSKEKVIALRDKLSKKNYDVSIFQREEEKHKMAIVEGWDEIIKQDSETIIKDYAKEQSASIEKRGWTVDQILNIVLNP